MLENQLKLKLIKSKVFNSGVITASYQPVK
jgi:hypothetical protein